MHQVNLFLFQKYMLEYVGQHLQGIAQVFRPEFRHFLSEPSGIYIRLVGMYVQVPLKNSKTCCHRITDIKQATL